MATEPENHRKGFHALKLALEVHRRGPEDDGYNKMMRHVQECVGVGSFNGRSPPPLVVMLGLSDKHMMAGMQVRPWGKPRFYPNPGKYPGGSAWG